MKKHLLRILIAGGMILTLYSCQKKDKEPSGPAKPGIQTIGGDVTFRYIDVIPTDLINEGNFLDANDEKIRCANYELTRAFIESVHPDEMQAVYEAATNAENPYLDVLYKDVFEQFPDLKTRVETKIADGNNFGLPYDFHSFGAIEQALIRGEYRYDPAISIINYSGAGSVALNPNHILLGAGLEYGDTGPEPTDDYHVFYLKQGVLLNIRLSEHEANTITLPFFNTTLHAIASLFPTSSPGTVSAKTTSPPWMQSNLSYKFKQTKLYSRHENDKHSEIFACGKAATFVPNQFPPLYPTKHLWGTDFNTDWACENRELAIIHKNDINGSVRNLNGLSTWLYNWNPSNILMEHYVTVIQVFERDWAAGRQRFGRVHLASDGSTPNANLGNVPKGLVLWGRASYQSDWYYADPIVNDGRSSTAIDDARKDVVYNQNGLWKGTGAGEVFMKIE